MFEPSQLPDPMRRFVVEHLTSSSHLSASVAEIEDIAAQSSRAGPSVRLNHSELWHRFSAIGTEMVITKSGRQVQSMDM